MDGDSPDAIKNKNIVSKSMTSDQIAEAQKISRELFSKIEETKGAENLDRINEGFAPPRIDPNTGLPF